MASNKDPYADYYAMKRVLTEQFKSCPVVDVIGIVRDSGGGNIPSDNFWTYSLRLTCWRVEKGPLKTKELSITQEVDYEQLQQLFGTTPANTIIRVKARVLEDCIAGTPQGDLVKIIGPDQSDEELNARLAEILKAFTFEDPDFGTFDLGRGATWTGKAKWKSSVIILYLIAAKLPQAKKALEVVRTLWADKDEWDERVRDFAAEKLLKLKNGKWIDKGDDDEPIKITAHQFKSRMTLKSIEVKPGGAFDFRYRCDKLFSGNLFVVSGSLEKGLIKAAIVR